MKTFLYILLVFQAQSAFSAINPDDLKPQVIEPNVYVVCKANSVVRTIRIEIDTNGCEAKYTKSGEDRVIGFGRSRNACQPFLENVRNNLEKANWSCRSIKNAKITAALVSEGDQQSSSDNE
jgi:hypothetical protein